MIRGGETKGRQGGRPDSARSTVSEFYQILGWIRGTWIGWDAISVRQVKKGLANVNSCNLNNYKRL